MSGPTRETETRKRERRGGVTSSPPFDVFLSFPSPAFGRGMPSFSPPLIRFRLERARETADMTVAVDGRDEEPQSKAKQSRRKEHQQQHNQERTRILSSSLNRCVRCEVHSQVDI